jgi:hypothetical protein
MTFSWLSFSLCFCSVFFCFFVKFIFSHLYISPTTTAVVHGLVLDRFADYISSMFLLVCIIFLLFLLFLCFFACSLFACLYWFSFSFSFLYICILASFVLFSCVAQSFDVCFHVCCLAWETKKNGGRNVLPVCWFSLFLSEPIKRFRRAVPTHFQCPIVKTFFLHANIHMIFINFTWC